MERRRLKDCRVCSRDGRLLSKSAPISVLFDELNELHKSSEGRLIELFIELLIELCLDNPEYSTRLKSEHKATIFEAHVAACNTHCSRV